MSLIITGCYGQCSSTMNKAFEELLWATLITAMLWALLIYEAAHLIGNMWAEDTEGVWVWQADDWHAAEEEEEEDPEGYAYDYEDDMARQRYVRVPPIKKRPGLQDF
jgi:hypothetical protein